MPKQDVVNRALVEIRKGYAQYQYFFDNLTSPAWLEPLSREGFFKEPRKPEREGDSVRIAIWPESRYLARMAQIAEAQEQVLKITLGIPDTENSRVHDDIADIALSLSPALAAKLVPQLSHYTKSPIKLLLAEKISNLIPHLAKGGQGKAALQLAAAALALAPDPRSFKDDDARRTTAEPQPRFRDWYYARIIHKSLPALVEANGLGTVDLFCRLLDDAARLSFREEETGDEDYFYIRQPAIEQGSGRDDAASVLLCATRDAAVQVISADSAKFDGVMQIFQRHNWASFRRLELHISRVFLKLKQSLLVADSFFWAPEILDRPSLRHEAVLLLKESFSQLGKATQQNILDWIDAEPPEEPIRRLLEFVNESVTDEKVAQMKKVRRRDHFAILEGQLPESYQHKYEALIAEVGPPNPPERLPMRTFSQIGAQSPKSSTELATMTVADVLGFLASWKPSTDIFAPTADGLAGALTSTIAQRPTEFIAVASQFKTLDPTYARAFFAGVTSALKNGVKLDWEPVLELATWVVTQPRAIAGRKGGLMVADPDWGWTRDSIIDLLKVGFDIGEERLPYEHRVLAWGALLPLTNDPSPSLESEQGERFDPSFVSINSTRGRALFAVMEYAQWVRKYENARKPAEAPPVNLDVMPEVREILDRHLDFRQEPTLTIRSVYGQDLSFLAGLDWEWFRANVGHVLPLGRDESAYFNAAWESFVVFNQPNDTLLRELEPAYRKAIADINLPRTMSSPASPEDSLADHLMAYYWRGHLTFEGKDRLLEDFYTHASDSVRGHAMWYIGRSVAGWDDAAPQEVFERLRSLMERRLHVVERSVSSAPFAKELAGFGWWFTADKFGDAWSLGMLLKVLRLTKETEGGMDVVKLLAELAAQYPLECVACLDLMVQGDRDNWVLVGVEVEARKTIKAALDSGQHDTVVAARSLVELLIARGQYGFRSLLSESASITGT
jgi:hypothetical protein